MGKKLFLLPVFLFCWEMLYSQLAINTDGSSPNPAAMPDVKSTGKGLLIPRMTYSQRPVTPVTGTYAGPMQK